MKTSRPKPKRRHTVWTFGLMFIGGILGIFGISGDRFWAQIVLLLFGTLFLISGLYAADGLNRKR